MNVLSCFDGMSCGQLALKKLGMPYDVYYASEIDKHAIKVTQANFPETVQLGNVEHITASVLPKITLLLAGSPCQGFSNSGKQQGLDDPRSRLLYEFLRLRDELKPKYWLLENVSMKKEFLKKMNELVGCEPIIINSKLVSAQNRVRLYWSNFPMEQPEDLNVTLDDIVNDKLPLRDGSMPKDHLKAAAIRGRRLNKATIVGRRLDDRGCRQDYDKTVPITQCLEVRKTNTNKSNCLTTVGKDNVLTPLPQGRHPNAFDLPWRYYSLKEWCQLQTVPIDYFEGVASESQAKKMLGNGWTVDVIVHILRGLK